MATEAITELAIRSAFVNSYSYGKYFLEEGIHVGAERNRLVFVPVKDLIRSVDFKKSRIKLTKNRVEINLVLDVSALIEKLKKRSQIHQIDERKCKAQLKEGTTVELVRPLIDNWEEIEKLHGKLFQKITPEQFSDLTYEYYEATEFIKRHVQRYADELLSRFIKDNVLWGEANYVFSELLIFLSNLKNFCLEKGQQYGQELNPQNDFKNFDKRFTQANLFLLDFLLKLEEGDITVKNIQLYYNTFLREINGLDLLRPRKLPQEMVNILLKHREEILA